MIEADLELSVLLRHLVEEARSLVGARYGALNPTDTAGTTAQAKTAAGPDYNNGNLTVAAPTCSPTPCASGGSISVTVNYSLSLITPLAAVIKFLPGAGSVPGTLTLTSTTVMRVQ